MTFSLSLPSSLIKFPITKIKTHHITTITKELAVLTASNLDITALRVQWKMLQFHDARGEYSNSAIAKIKDNELK